MIEFKHVDKSFGQTAVLHDINLNINQGEVVVIIGPSGSGNQRCCAVSTSWKKSAPASFWLMAWT